MSLIEDIGHNTIDRYHPNWQPARLQIMLEFIPPEFFRGKNVLELGPYNGYFGNYFQKALGANVTSVEGRIEHVENLKTHYPNLNVIHADLDVPDWPYGRVDAIINFGLCYHLEKHHRQHLINCIDNCDLMFFESVIFDSYEPEIFFRIEEGFDQSMSGRAGVPSTSYIENIFLEKNCEFIRISSPRLNADTHYYTWPDINARNDDGIRRRFWIVKPPKRNP